MKQVRCKQAAEHVPVLPNRGAHSAGWRQADSFIARFAPGLLPDTGRFALSWIFAVFKRLQKRYRLCLPITGSTPPRSAFMPGIMAQLDRGRFNIPAFATARDVVPDVICVPLLALTNAVTGWAMAAGIMIARWLPAGRGHRLGCRHGLFRSANRPAGHRPV